MRLKSPVSLNSSSGFSLVGTLIAAGILGILSLIFASLFADMIKGQSTLRMRNEVEAFHQELRSYLGNRQACLNSFAGLGAYTHASNRNVTGIKEPDSTTVNRFALTTAYGSGSFEIQEMSVTYIDTAPVGDKKGEATLRVKYRTKISVIGPETLADRLVLMSFSLNATDQLTECLALASGTAGGGGSFSGTCAERSQTFTAANPNDPVSGAVTCAADETLVSGGAYCSPIDATVGHSYPNDNTWHAGNCHKYNLDSTTMDPDAPAKTIVVRDWFPIVIFARCCK